MSWERAVVHSWDTSSKTQRKPHGVLAALSSTFTSAQSSQSSGCETITQFFISVVSIELSGIKSWRFSCCLVSWDTGTVGTSPFITFSFVGSRSLEFHPRCCQGWQRSRELDCRGERRSVLIPSGVPSLFMVFEDPPILVTLHLMGRGQGSHFTTL